jgi:hypothetical protein
MCGIYFSARKRGSTSQLGDHESFDSLSEVLRQANALRGLSQFKGIDIASYISETGVCLPLGPDAHKSHILHIEDQSVLDLEFFSSELRLRGDEPIVQPHTHDGDVLCWNGEVCLLSSYGMIN